MRDAQTDRGEHLDMTAFIRQIRHADQPAAA
jgi:hypothetical protein